MTASRSIFAAALTGLALVGCASEGDLVIDQSVGVTAIRTACPAVGVPDYTGDVTTFRSPGATTAEQIDIVASITNVRPTCNEQGEKVYSEASFDVLARRTDTAGARTVEIPYYSTVLQGGSAVQAKRIGTIRVAFADGQDRAQATGRAGAFIERAAATLPADIREQITRKRKAGDPDAALDPLADPQVRAAVQRATFELLIGFQLTQEQLAYNATR
ncbi:MAG: hypothetical protein WA948_02140 [Pontixanthobacter sp.]